MTQENIVHYNLECLTGKWSRTIIYLDDSYNLRETRQMLECLGIPGESPRYVYFRTLSSIEFCNMEVTVNNTNGMQVMADRPIMAPLEWFPLYNVGEVIRASRVKYIIYRKEVTDDAIDSGEGR